jgi:hypothetical protein
LVDAVKSVSEVLAPLSSVALIIISIKKYQGEYTPIRDISKTTKIWGFFFNLIIK